MKNVKMYAIPHFRGSDSLSNSSINARNYKYVFKRTEEYKFIKNLTRKLQRNKDRYYNKYRVGKVWVWRTGGSPIINMEELSKKAWYKWDIPNRQEVHIVYSCAIPFLREENIYRGKGEEIKMYVNWRWSVVTLMFPLK